MKVIITGTKGFIGKNLLNSIKELGHDVYEINEDFFSHPNWVNLFSNSIKNYKPDVIFHVGACSDTLEKDATYMMTRNYESTKIISNYCKENNCKLIYSSSAANYGTNNLHPSNLYGWSKYVAEQYVILNGGVALRYFNVYGYGESHKGNMSSIVFQMMEKQNKNEKIKLFPGSPKRDFVYIKDVISANLHALKNYDQICGKFYEVGTGESRTFENILECLGINEYDYFDENEIPKGYQFFTESKRDLWMPRWEPKYFLEKGIDDYIKNFSYSKKRKLWVFGDSFSQSFSQHFKTQNKWALDYKEYKKGHIPKVYGEIIAEKLGLEFFGRAFGGASNYHIFEKFIKEIDNIHRNDIVIFNWTEITRFPLASNTNSLVVMTPFAGHSSPNDLVTQQTIQEIGVNRGDNSVYWEIVLNYIKVIQSILKFNKVYHWTWVKHEVKTPTKVWDYLFGERPICVRGWKNANDKTKEMVKEYANLVVDIEQNNNVDEIKEFISEGKKVYFVNVDDNFELVKEYITDPLKINWLDVTDHFLILQKEMLPYKEYQTIYMETGGVVKDMHYSENGHNNLAKDLLVIINGEKKSII